MEKFKGAGSSTNSAEQTFCSKCKRPKYQGKRGSFSSWLFQVGCCKCLDSDETSPQSHEIDFGYEPGGLDFSPTSSDSLSGADGSDSAGGVKICSSCGLTISRDGSMTAWVFQTQRCQCAKGATKQRQSVQSFTKLADPTHQEQQVSSRRADKSQEMLDGRYTMLERIGQGGVGLVYRAHDSVSGELVAIKLMRAELAEHERALQRFRREVDTVCEVNHPNLGKVFGYGRDQKGQPYLVMELVTGENLEEILKKSNNGIEQKRAVNLFIQICEGLAVAHGRIVIHRDLKPSNVIIYKDDEGREGAKIVDFGFAKVEDAPDASRMTQKGEVFGSPYYMSPEQCLGQKIDSRSDIYSLGCLMYEVLTGQVPLLGENILATVAKQVSEEPVPPRELNPSVSEALESVVLKCLVKEPLTRYQTVTQLLDDLNKLKQGSLKSVHRSKRSVKSGGSKLENIRHRSGMDPGLLAGIVILNIVILSVVVAFVFQNNSKTADPTAPVTTGTNSKGAQSNDTRSEDGDRATIKDESNQPQSAGDSRPQTQQTRKNTKASKTATNPTRVPKKARDTKRKDARKTVQSGTAAPSTKVWSDLDKLRMYK